MDTQQPPARQSQQQQQQQQQAPRKGNAKQNGSGAADLASILPVIRKSGILSEGERGAPPPVSEDPVKPQKDAPQPLPSSREDLARRGSKGLLGSMKQLRLGGRSRSQQSLAAETANVPTTTTTTATANVATTVTNTDTQGSRSSIGSNASATTTTTATANINKSWTSLFRRKQSAKEDLDGSAAPPNPMPVKDVPTAELLTPSRYASYHEAQDTLGDMPVVTASKSSSRVRMLLPQELCVLLEKEQARNGSRLPSNAFTSSDHVLLLLDFRSLEQVESGGKIRGSTTVNIPSMLQKRYAKGTMQTLNLGQFMADNDQAKLAWSSSCHKTVVFYDKQMPSAEKDWELNTPPSYLHALVTLLNLNKIVCENVDSILWLAGGYDAFRQQFPDTTKWYQVEGGAENGGGAAPVAVVASISSTASTTTSNHRLSFLTGTRPRLQSLIRPAPSTSGNNSSATANFVPPFSLPTDLIPPSPVQTTMEPATSLDRPSEPPGTTTADIPGKSTLLDGPVFVMSEVPLNSFPEPPSPSQFSYARITDWLYFGPDPAVYLRFDQPLPLGHRQVLVPASESLIPGAGGMPSNTDGTNQELATERLDVTATAERLDDMDFRYVINVAQECPDLGQFLLRQGSTDPEGVPSEHVLDAYFKVGCWDNPRADIGATVDRIIPILDDLERRIRGHGGRVYLHCKAGISRSATVLLAYLIRLHGWSWEEALHFVRLSRPCVDPNIGFIGVLKQYETKYGHKNGSSSSNAGF